jgi:hypothetical protein
MPASASHAVNPSEVEAPTSPENFRNAARFSIPSTEAVKTAKSSRARRVTSLKAGANESG